MPSRLIPYQGCASFLDQKIQRSIGSVIDQSFEDFELLVISDDCEETKIIVKRYDDPRVVLLQCKHKAIFDNLPRNTGLDNAKGEYIIYLDIDDFYGVDHLKIVDKNLKNYDWVWYNDYTKMSGQWGERACNIRALGGSGTSNVCHKRSLNLRWDRPGYAHDFHFNQKLLKFQNHTKIETPEYFVMHIPGIYDI